MSTTEAGERLLVTLRPALADIETALGAVKATTDTPAGTVRITAIKHAVTSVLWPILPAFLDRYPDIRIEIDVDDGLIDIVGDRFDAGIRFRGGIAKDMIAARVGPPLLSVIVGAPGYFAEDSRPDLARHRCIVHRMTGVDGIYP